MRSATRRNAGGSATSSESSRERHGVDDPVDDVEERERGRKDASRHPVHAPGLLLARRIEAKRRYSSLETRPAWTSGLVSVSVSVLQPNVSAWSERQNFVLDFDRQGRNIGLVRDLGLKGSVSVLISVRKVCSRLTSLMGKRLGETLGPRAGPSACPLGRQRAAADACPDRSPQRRSTHHRTPHVSVAVVRCSTRSTQPCIPPGSLNRVPASAEVKAGMSPLSDPIWHVSSRIAVWQC